jgi:hypothetical protein
VKWIYALTAIGVLLLGLLAWQKPSVHNYAQAAEQAARIATRADIVSALTTAPTISAAQRAKIETAWRIEAAQSGKGPVTTALMNTALSQTLKRDVARSNGQIEQIMVIDASGALIAADHPTHDFDQSDEDKWQKTVGAQTMRPLFEGSDAGKRGITDQISQSVRGPDGKIVGAITLRWCNTPGGCA